MASGMLESTGVGNTLGVRAQYENQSSSDPAESLKARKSEVPAVTGHRRELQKCIQSVGSPVASPHPEALEILGL